MKQMRLFNDGRKERIKRIVKAVAIGFKVWLAIVGLFSFSLFLFEESIQMTTFGIWAAKDGQNWILMRKGIEKIERINRTMRIINHYVGWLQPIGYLSYESYAQATDSYVASVRSQVFAYAPELFDGERVRFTFEPQSVKLVDGKRHYQGRNLTVITDRDLKLGRKIEIVGVVHVDDAGVQIVE